MTRRVGVLGGAFNPIHFGHLLLAQEMRWRLGLDHVVLVPSFIGPHKQRQSMEPFHHRVAMARLASAAYPWMEVLDLEGQRSGPSYTYDTLDALQTSDPGTTWVLLTGMDVALEIHTWYRYHDLALRWVLAVGTRPGWSPPQNQVLWPSVTVLNDSAALDEPTVLTGPFPVPPATVLVDVPGLDIASSVLRERLQRGHPAHFLTPESVLAYVSTHTLYGPTTDHDPDR